MRAQPDHEGPIGPTSEHIAVTMKKPDPHADRLTLKDYGWNAHFERQIADEERTATRAVRVLAVHRDALDVAGPAFEGRVQPPRGESEGIKPL